MKIVFMGTPEFAVPSLKILLEHNYEIVSVVTAPDHLGGRGGKQLLQSPVKRFALDHGLMVLQPSNLKSKIFVNQLKTLQADIHIVVAFRMLPEVIWSMPPLGTINVHGSLLPKYRGAAPINWAVINGESSTGVTTFRLKHEIDTGDIYGQRQIEIYKNENATSVHDRLMEEGARLLLDTLQHIESGKVKPMIQNEGEVSHAPKIFHETCKIDFNWSAKKIHDFIRGLSRFPLAYTYLDGKELKIDTASYELNDHAQNIPRGTFFTDGKRLLTVSCSDGFIHIHLLKLEGKKLMQTTDFLNGYSPLEAMPWTGKMGPLSPILNTDDSP